MQAILRMQVVLFMLNDIRRLGLQFGALGLRLVRQNRQFDRFLAEFRQLYAGPKELFDEWRAEREVRIREFAQTRCAFYRLQALRDQIRVDKQAVRDDPDAFTAGSRRGIFDLSVRTSGTTGVGLAITSTSEHQAAQAASWWLFRSLYGVSMDDVGLVIGGRTLPERKGVSGRWVFLRALNQVYVSAFDLTEESISQYLGLLTCYNVRWIHGYPSAILQIVDFIERRGWVAPAGILLVSTGSESISVEQRLRLGRAFGAPVSEFYGQVEGVCSMWRCPDGALHDLGVMGRIDLDEREGFGDFEIVGSGYWNEAMPLLGYRTGDTILERLDQCSCGHPYVLAREIEGRIDDYVVGQDGRKVGRLARLFTLVSGCSDAQLAQRSIGSFELRLGAGGAVDAAEFKSRLEEMLREEISLEILRGAEIRRTRSGKVRSVVREF